MPAELATSIAPTDDDARLMQAEALVRAYCGWHIAPVRTTTLHLHAADGIIVLPTLKLVSVDELTSGDELQDPTTYTATPGGLLRLPTRFVPRYDAYWGQGYDRSVPRDYTVTFTHGYDAPPPEVTAVVQALAVRGVNNPRGLKQEQTGPFTDTYFGSGLTTDDLAALWPYKLAARP